MWIATKRQMNEFDRFVIDELGLPGTVLMENAGEAVVRAIVKRFDDRQTAITIVASNGNNGGDGFVIARKLLSIGFHPTVLFFGTWERLTGDAAVHAEAFRVFGGHVIERPAFDRMCDVIDSSDVIVDALLGTGYTGPLREPFPSIIARINTSRAYVYAVDLPSGVEASTGRVVTDAVRADETITFIAPKCGFFLEDGPRFIGKWTVDRIGVPFSVDATVIKRAPYLFTEREAIDRLPKRPADGHKGTFGHVLTLGGSHSYVGAPLFSAKMAMHSGAGLVTLATPTSIYEKVAASLPEVLFLPLPEREGHMTEEAIPLIESVIDGADVLAVGPGFGLFEEGSAIIRQLLDVTSGQPIVFDADALTLLVDLLDALRAYRGDVIVTPHPGEMARLLQTDVPTIESDRLGAAYTLATTYRIHVVLKGHRTIVTSPSGDQSIIPYGTDALGKGGSGDVLTGLIASFLAQGISTQDALRIAVVLHARSGERASETLSSYGVTPLSLIDAIPRLLRQWQTES